MAEISGQTGGTKRITLPSSIEQVSWSRDRAVAGGLVALEIDTLFVGDNSQLQVEISDASGKSFGKYSERMAGGRFRAPIRVPEAAREGLYATVTLPKHGLRKRSSPLLILPPVQIGNVKWSKSEARSGDMLSLSADLKGVPDGAETLIEIFEHDTGGAHELVSRFLSPVKNRKIEAEWEFSPPRDDGSETAAEPPGKQRPPTTYFFRINVAGLTIDSGPLEYRK